MNHPFLRRFVPILVLIVMFGVLLTGVTSQETSVLVFTWRPYAAFVIAAMLVTSWIMYLLVRRSALQKGAFYWFFLFTGLNLLWQTVTLLDTLSATPEASAFWQGMLPVAWIPVSLVLLFFALSYIDDTDLPNNLGLWSVPVISTFVLIFLAGATNVIEAHVPQKQVYDQLWGYTNSAGDYETLVFVWVFAVSIATMVLFIKAYRHSVDRIRRQQLKLFIIGIGQYITLAILIDIVLYSFYPNYPAFSVFYSTIMCSVIGYGIIKHGIFKIDPQSLAIPILDNLSEAVIAVNPEMIIEFANDGAEKMLGYKKVDFRSKHLADLFEKHTFESIQAEMSDIDDRTLTFEDIIVVNHSGGMVPATVIVSSFSHGDSVAGYIFVVQNITELKKRSIELAHEKANVERRVIERTKELHEERAKLHASIESLALGFVLIDPSGKVVIKNKAIGLLLGDDAGFNDVNELSHVLHGFQLAKYCTSVLTIGAPSVLNEVNYRDKVLRIFVAGVDPDDATSGQSKIGSVVLIEDITEVKVLERSRDEFFSIASHELRTPLTAIRGNSSMILDYYKDSMQKEAKDVIGDIHESSVRLISIVNDFLDMSRLEQGKVPFNYTECELDKIIENVVYEMRTDIKEKKLAIRYEGMTLGKLPKIWADETRTKQIVYNLVSNAIKFTDKNGNITIVPTVVRDHVKISVIDTGRGIPVESRKLLFHKFQQAGNSILTRETSRGTGLGLYISRLLAEEMGGELKLDHTETDKGSTFSFTLLVANDENKNHRTRKPVEIDTSTGLSIG